MDKWKSFFDNPEEIFVGALLQFPLYFLVKWWVIPVMIVCGFLWRYGGWEHGNKLARRFGAPLLVCIVPALTLHMPILMCAIPFMVWIAPSYGKDSWLYKITDDDFLTRLVCFSWYWSAFTLAYVFSR